MRRSLIPLLVLTGVMLVVAIGFAQEAHAAVAEGRNPLIYIGAALAVGFPAFATGYAQAKIGSAGAGALAEKPELTGPIIIMVAIPETTVILGFVIAILLFVL